MHQLPTPEMRINGCSLASIACETGFSMPNIAEICGSKWFSNCDPHYHNLVTLNLQEDGLVETRNLEEPMLNPFLCYTRRVQFKSGWFEMTRLVLLTLVNNKIRQFKYVGRYTAWNLGHKIIH